MNHQHTHSHTPAHAHLHDHRMHGHGAGAPAPGAPAGPLALAPVWSLLRLSAVQRVLLAAGLLALLWAAVIAVMI